MEFYTYVWRDAAQVPFYVGKGKGRRAFKTADRSKEFKEIYSQGDCAVEIVDWFMHESQAHALEVELIERYGRREIGGLLVNKTDGGEGVSGIILSDEARKKISVANTGNTYCLGREMSGETRAKIARSRTGISPSAETRAKIGAAHRGRQVSPETRSRLSVVGRNCPPKSGRFKGVTTAGGTWMARILVSGESKYLGRFAAEEDAARAYDAAAIAVWGVGNCYLNFPTSVPGEAA